MATMSLSDFKQNLGQVVRPNRFYVFINPPEVGNLIELRDKSSDTMIFHVKSASIPSRSIGEYELKYYGYTIKLPGDVNYTDLSVTFINEGSWAIRTFFETWQDVIYHMMNDTFDGIRYDAQDLLVGSNIVIQQIGNNDEDILAEYTFYNVFPKEVGEMELNMETYDSVQEFQVTFAYSHWIRSDK
jgi:hypothetical protein